MYASVRSGLYNNGSINICKDIFICFVLLHCGHNSIIGNVHNKCQLIHKHQGFSDSLLRSFENNKAYVSIDGTKYSAEDVTAVISEEYQSSYDLAVAFCVAMNKLPGIDQLTYGDKETVETLKKGYEAMTTYQKSFVPDDYATKLQKYVERMEELVKEHDRAQENAGESGKNGENADKTQEA